MTIKSFLAQTIKQYAFKRGLIVERTSVKGNNPSQLEAFFARFREKYVSVNLIRIGGQGDGGYLVPDCLDDIRYCFSAGVADVADFEQELSDRYNIKSFMADASVEHAPVQGDNFEFIKKLIGNPPANSQQPTANSQQPTANSQQDYITLSDWVQHTIGNDSSPKLFQMDIEGGEFDVLICESLASFSIVVIEFHDLHRMFGLDFLHMISALFEKIYRDFSICHVHPNNWAGRGGMKTFDGISIPSTIEVTLIRNDLIAKCRSDQKILLPHEFDRKNVPEQEDIVMPDIWWRSCP